MSNFEQVAGMIYLLWMISGFVLSFPGIPNDNIKNFGWGMIVYGILFAALGLGGFISLKLFQVLTA